MNTPRGIKPLVLLFLLVLPNLQGQKISVQNGNWGTANAKDITCVLESTSQIFLPYLLFLKEKKISVYPSSMPKIYYDRSHSGEYRINLSAKDRNWCQYAFQFAHELAHLICRTKRGDSSNNWFEESLCEAVSLYALNELSNAWSDSPPFPTWHSYAIEFKKYRADRIRNSDCPENFQISSWWKENKSLLCKNSNLRKQNLWVAIQILPIIEERPEVAWGAMEWLNHSKSHKTKSFRKYLYEWKMACPEKQQKEFVLQVSEVFGIFKLRNLDI